MTTIINGSSPSITFSDGTTQSTAFVNSNKGYRKYIYDASTTWTKPSNLAYIQVTVVGGGGGGGGCVSSSTDNGQAGNSGAVSFKKILAASLGSTETVTVGAGGSGGAAGSNDGSAGGSSSFGSHLSANGGSGGYHSTNANRTVTRTANTSSGGDINYESAYLGTNIISSEVNTTNTSSASALWATQLPIVQFISAQSAQPGENGKPSFAFGIGGGGSDGDALSNLAGGDGYKGCVVVEEFYNLT